MHPLMQPRASCSLCEADPGPSSLHFPASRVELTLNLMSLKKKRPDNHNDHGREQHKNGEPVDPMHIAYPASTNLIGVYFINVEIFCYLSLFFHYMIFYYIHSTTYF